MKYYEQTLKEIDKRAKVEKGKEKNRKKTTFRKALVLCVSFCLILLISIFAAMKFIPDKNIGSNDEMIDSTNNTHENIINNQPIMNNDKRVISSIPNAKIIENTEYFIAERTSVSDIYTVEEYIEVLKNYFTIVTGSVSNMNSVAISEDEFTWYITTFDINISESIKKQMDADTITCVTICKYYDDVSVYNSKCGLTDVAYDIMNNPTGLFVLEDVEETVWNINGETFNVSDFADYYVGVRYDCTTESFQYYGTSINFEDIRNN